MASITTLNSGDALEPTSRNNINTNFANLNTDKLEAADVTYANLNANGDVGTGATQVSQGDHAHTHGSLTGIGTDDHHAEAHTIASHSDTTATGAELETLTDGSNADALHAHALSDPGLVFVASNTTEGSHSTNVNTDMVTVGSLSIPTTDPIVVRFQYRKDNAGVGEFRFRMKVNGTVVVSEIPITASNGDTVSGFAEVQIPPRETNYLNGGTIVASAKDFATVDSASIDAAFPNASTTSIVLGGRNTSGAGVLIAIKNVYVYTVRTS